MQRVSIRARVPVATVMATRPRMRPARQSDGEVRSAAWVGSSRRIYIATPMAGDLNHAFEPLAGDQRAARQIARQHGVGGDSCAMQDPGDVAPPLQNQNAAPAGAMGSVTLQDRLVVAMSSASSRSFWFGIVEADCADWTAQ